MLSDTADYGLLTVDCQVVILFSGVWAPPQKKTWNFAPEIAHFIVF